MKYKGYYTLKEIEEKFGKSRHTVRMWIKNGAIEYTKGMNPFCKQEIYIKKEDWDKIPDFIKKPRWDT